MPLSPPPIVPPRPDALGVCTRTPAMSSTASTTSIRTSAFRTLSMGLNSGILLVAVGDGLPVQGVEPGRDVVRALVLVLEVVGVLPHVDAEDRGHAFHVRAVLVRVALDRELAARVGDQPCPAAAELADRGLLQLLLEGVVPPERAVDGVADPA